MSKFIKLIGFNTSVRDEEHEIWINISNIATIDAKAHCITTTEHECSAYCITEESMQKLIELVGEK